MEKKTRQELSGMTARWSRDSQVISWLSEITTARRGTTTNGGARPSPPAPPHKPGGTKTGLSENQSVAMYFKGYRVNAIRLVYLSTQVVHIPAVVDVV